MGRLKSRQERFCRKFVECANASAAARAAGYSAEYARNAGYRLLRHPLIAARIAAIQAETAQAACRNVDVLLGKLETVYRRSVDDHNFSTAARAVELQARLSGLACHTDVESGAPGRDQSALPPENENSRGRSILSGGPIVHRSGPRLINGN